MGFLDDLKKGANSMASSINTAVSGDPNQAKPAYPSESYFHDLGVLAYLQQTGRATEQTPAEMERVMTGLQQNEQMGALTSFALRTAAPAPPPAPGQPVSSPPAPVGGPVAPPPAPVGGPVAPPPAPGGAVPPPPAPGQAVTPPPPPGGAVPPPPAPGQPVSSPPAPGGAVPPPPAPGTVAPPPPPGAVASGDHDAPAG
ncbi:MAG: hypothetical protein HYX32_04045 [Actinobacteria bacterium]|nr:hypothetical protein [Actinomycetota bacterium]